MKSIETGKTRAMAFAGAAALMLAACGGEAGGDAGADAGGGAAADKPDLASVEDCPTTGADFRGTTETVNCGCSGFKTGVGVVFGSGPYLDDSSICKAAVHAGIIEDGGEGVVAVTPMDADGVEFTESEANGVKAAPYISSEPAKGAYSLK